MAERRANRDEDLGFPKSERRGWRRFERRERARARMIRRERHDAESSDRDRDRDSNDRVGRLMEAFARGMGTPAFLIALTIFCALWIVWNAMAPGDLRFDSAALGFTALTLMLSLQASYAAPMLLLAQNRQDDRDRVQIEQDRQRAERNTADLEYLAREIVALRLLVADMASKDFIRAELRSLLEDLEEHDEDDDEDPRDADENRRTIVRRTRAADGEEYRERETGEQRRRARVRKEAEAAEQARARDD